MPIHVFKDVGGYPRKHVDGPSRETNIAGSKVANAVSLVFGIWSLDDTEEPFPETVIPFDEIKHVLTGFVEFKDLMSGNTYTGEPGTTIWLPRGSKLQILRTKDFSAHWTAMMEATECDITEQ
ncbi:hypothetical protein EDB81DRAFT_764480 [Dactylonectria macrodidyma]|uniref:Uncharacterized protein n=1 Tax=Dactylonectria macrodidyma TaxID=307937 RepID=A0A9P9DY26_9HYPO|nr:hypothetical protein EDB81DRAFT_764480 [Dactylonectria macrodidyma]